MTTHQPLPHRLSHGDEVALESLDAGLGGLTIYLDRAFADAAPLEVDMSVLLLGHDAKVAEQTDFVFYNQRSARDGAVQLRDKLTDTTHSAANPSGWMSDVLTLELDDLPDRVQRIALIASVDDEQRSPLQDTGGMQLRIQRTADAADLVLFDVVPSGSESALLFAQLSRVGSGWHVAAVNRSFDTGLASLVVAHGVEIDGAEPQDSPAEHPEPAPMGSDSSPPPSPVTDNDTEPTGRAGAVMKRAVVAPKLPADWNRSIPADNAQDWQPSRLFPVAGVGSGEEQERRATSALLAVMQLVRDFGRVLTVPMGAPRGTMTTFLEVPFSQDEEAYRPDGVIRIARGHKEWTALVEVKTSSGRLNADQINHYLEIATSRGFDAVITISNQLKGGDDDHPIAIDRRKLRKVSLFHLSWDQIRAVARLTSHQGKITDRTQQLVLDEFLRYMDHARSGMTGLTDMGSSWVKVRDGVKARTARANDRHVGDVSSRFDELVQHVGFELTGLLGVQVSTSPPRDAPDHSSRRQQLADSGVVRGRLKVPGAVDEIVIGADIRADRVSAAITVPAPRGDTRPQTRVAWLLRQIPEAAGPSSIRIETLLSGGRGDGPVALLGTARKDPSSLLPVDQREIRAFSVTLEHPMGARRAAGSGTLIGSVRKVSTTFYGDVVQHLRPWTAKRI